MNAELLLGGSRDAFAFDRRINLIRLSKASAMAILLVIFLVSS